ncbi:MULTISPECIES: MBL fold metallo-hydrolase [unclassified Paenibacillus]|uniref:MBL fold metallo-hydrolase n=1 Tax=unclassified Paenibacillus TaxID=185978 RepID=UPI001F121983|nr:MULTISPECIES: MBL fold metallo-hydrolase [unclassified Paenibacillus]
MRGQLGLEDGLLPAGKGMAGLPGIIRAGREHAASSEESVADSVSGTAKGTPDQGGERLEREEGGKPAAGKAAEHGAEREAAVAERLDNGWFRVKVPLPYSLRYVNSYLVPETDGSWTLIDPGLHTAECRDIWLQELDRLGIRIRDIGRILLTHQHPDHYGLAGWFQQQAGCPVLMTAEAGRYARRLWGSGSGFAAELTGWFRNHGMPEELLDQLGPHLASFRERVEPQPRLTDLEPGSRLDMGGESWEIIDAPGHAGGGVCLYSAASLTLIAGDQVLPRITPNISLIPGTEEDPDPLASYLDSLRGLSGLETKRVLPGHRDPFADAGRRAMEIIAHHERRLEHLRRLLAEGPASAFDLCEREFGTHLRHNIHNLRFAMSETLAHLAWLARRGEAAVSGPDGGPWMYASA